MAGLGHEVLGTDVDAERIAALSAARTSLREPGLHELLARSVASGRLRFSTSPAEAASFARTHCSRRRRGPVRRSGPARGVRPHGYVVLVVGATSVYIMLPPTCTPL
ncbi:hypothetical protein [Streptomyces sp. ISL-96]|uniref:hypothetical protein n=1 Tax=Streptomyces sp. ISL-96 TaxID=2819191 RepID=UPI0027E36533|nr:hypothetical protein [Streptomyces sp. ISL-96]